MRRHSTNRESGQGWGLPTQQISCWLTTSGSLSPYCPPNKPGESSTLPSAALQRSPECFSLIIVQENHSLWGIFLFLNQELTIFHLVKQQTQLSSCLCTPQQQGHRGPTTGSHTNCSTLCQESERGLSCLYSKFSTHWTILPHPIFLSEHHVGTI